MAVFILREEEPEDEGVKVFVPDSPPSTEGQSQELSIAGQWLGHYEEILQRPNAYFGPYSYSI